MRLKVKILGLEAGGKPIVIINHEDAEDLGIKSLGRVGLQTNKKSLTAIVNITTKIVPKGWIGVYEEVRNSLKLKENDEVEVDVAKYPNSLQFIRNKLKGGRLSYDEILEIVKDTVAGNLNEIEIASFITALNDFGMNLDEITSLTLAMVETGKQLKLNKKFIADKHCLPENIPTIVRNDGNVIVETIGTIIDSIFEKCSPEEICRDGEAEFTNKNLRNLHVLVHDDNGETKFVPVSAVYRVKSPKYLKEIILVGNRSIQCTDDHTIFVFKNGRIKNIPAKEIKEGDYVLVPTKINREKTIEEISLKTGLKEDHHYKKIKDKIRITPEFMRLLGYYISEGFTNYQGVFFNFGSHEKKLVEDCIKCIESVFGIGYTINKPHKTAIRICIYSQILSEIFTKIIKAGSNALEKRIPSFVFDVEDSLKIEFLKALFKGDGYRRRGYEAVYVTSSKKLATDLQYLLSSMGISVTLSVIKKYKRKFPPQNNCFYESEVQESYQVYTQSREIFGGRRSVSAAFINLLPVKELGEIEKERIGWKFRRELKVKKYMTKQKLKRIIKYIKSNDAKKLINGSISVLRVKKVRNVESTSRYVYDFKVDEYNRFVAGTAPICIHNSIGGCVGDKTTLLLVPLVAAAGLTIPKTSSRAITSPGGTADRAECLMPVDLDIEEMKRVVEKTNGCMVWGGALHLAPADDIFIQVEYPLSIDPLLLPSIMSKKKAVGTTHLVIDIPCGRGTKVKTIGDAELLARDFIELSKRLGIKTKCAITYGEQPIGYTIGPALEAKEALEVLMKKKNIPDLIDKATDIAAILFEMTGKAEGKQLALDILKSGKAEKKLREIIMEQGGDKDIKPEDIEIGSYGVDFTAQNDGIVLWMDNNALVELARAAGAPKDKGAGIQLYKKVGDPVKKDEKLFTVYAEKSRKLERIRNVLEREKIVGVGERMEMLIHKVEELPTHRKAFILER